MIKLVFSRVSRIHSAEENATLAMQSSGFTMQALSKPAVSDTKNVVCSIFTSATTKNSSLIPAEAAPNGPGEEPSMTIKFSLSLVGGQELPGQ